MITLKYQFVVIILSNNSDDVCDVMYDVVCECVEDGVSDVESSSRLKIFIS